MGCSGAPGPFQGKISITQLQPVTAFKCKQQPVPLLCLYPCVSLTEMALFISEGINRLGSYHRSLNIQWIPLCCFYPFSQGTNEAVGARASAQPTGNPALLLGTAGGCPGSMWQGMFPCTFPPSVRAVTSLAPSIAGKRNYNDSFGLG